MTIAFSLDGKYIIAGFSKGKVAVWSLDNKTKIFEESGLNEIIFADFLCGNHDIVIVNKNGGIFVINLLVRNHVLELESRKKPLTASIDAGKRYLALINKKQEIEIIDLVAKMPLGVIDDGTHLKHAIFLGFDRLGQQLVAVTERGKVLSWNPATLRLLRQMNLGGGEWTGSSSLIHAASTNRSANVFIVGLEEIAIPKGGLKGMAHPTNLMRTNTVIAYDFKTGMEIKRVKFPYDYVTAIAMGPGNDHAAIVSYDSEVIHILDFRKGEYVAQVALNDKPTVVIVSDDDKYFAAGFENGNVGIWSLSSTEITSAYSYNNNILPSLGARIRPTQDLPPALQPGNPITMAILEFKSTGIKEDIGPVCLDMMHVGLANYPYITLVERDRIKEVIGQLSFSMSGLTIEDGIQAGKMLNADYILFCSVGALGTSKVFNARLVDVDLGSVVAGRGVIAEECRDQDVFDSIKMLISTLAK